MKLKILTWNIAWGYGFGSDGGPSYQPLPQAHFENSIAILSELINKLNVDIVLLQEVDFKSARSHDIAELDQISRKSGLLYRAGLVSWNHPYVPFPGLSPKRHFGRMLSGGGILSRFPIKPVFDELLPKPSTNSALYNWFYLNRYLQVADIEGVRFCNLHLEAFAQQNRELHLVKLQNRLIDYQIDVAGGDFNGAVEISPERAETYDVFRGPEPTFPSQAPTETFDGFIVKKSKFTNVSVKTMNVGTVSDHLPVFLELDLPEPA